MNVIKTRKPVIPEAYTQVEWVKSDGTGEIDLGKSYPNNHSSFKISMKYDVQTSAEPLFGAQHNSSNPLLVAYNGGFYCSGDTANDNRIKGGLFPNGVHTFEIEMKNQTVTYSRDNSEPTSYSVDPYSPTAYNSTDTVLVLAYHVAAGNIRKGTATMYYLKMEFDGEVFCDLIPVKRNSDNAVGMYDLATNTFFSISGTCGNPVSNPLMEDVYYGDIMLPKKYVEASSDAYPEILRGWGTSVFDGSETWNKHGSYPLFLTSAPTNAEIGSETLPCVCDRLKGLTPKTVAGSMADDKEVKVGYYSGTVVRTIYLRNDDCSTISDLTEWLSDNNLTVLYPLTVSDGSVWRFVKNTEDNSFGYYNYQTSTYVKAYNATGTVTGDLYDHYMLKGGD